MRQSTYVLILAAALVGCDAGSGSSGSEGVQQSQTAPASEAARTALTGRVTQNGDPVEGAVLIVSSVDTGLVPEDFDPDSMFTDALGAYRIELEPGRYRVIAVGPDRSQVEADVELSAVSDPLDLELTLDPEAERDFVENGPRFERSEEAQ